MRYFLMALVIATFASATRVKADCLQWGYDRWNAPHCLGWGWVDGNYPGGYVPPQAYGYAWTTPYAGEAYVVPQLPPGPAGIDIDQSGPVVLPQQAGSLVGVTRVTGGPVVVGTTPMPPEPCHLCAPSHRHADAPAQHDAPVAHKDSPPPKAAERAPLGHHAARCTVTLMGDSMLISHCGSK